jgi:hypothetical protein
LDFFGGKTRFSNKKIIPSSNEKLEKKMQNLGETFLLFVTFLIMSSVMPLEQRLPKRGDAYYWEFPSPRSPCVKHRQKFILIFIRQLS